MESKNENSETKKGLSTEYLKQMIDVKNLSESHQRLLTELIERKVDHRPLLRMKMHMFDLFPDQDIPLDEWRKESFKYFKSVPEDIQEKLITELCTEDKQMIDRKHLIVLLDTLQYMPIKIKRDKNQSNNLYYILSSNQRDKPQSKEEIL
jgi:hypothetical protein